MMNTLRIVSLSALFYLASSPATGQQDPDDCRFTVPFLRSPMTVFDGSSYRFDSTFNVWERVFPPFTRVPYLASTVGEETLPCAIWGYHHAFSSIYYFLSYRTGPTPEIRAFNLTIRAYSQRYLPWFTLASCSWIGFCVSTGYHSVVAVGPGNPAYFFTGYVFYTFII